MTNSLPLHRATYVRIQVEMYDGCVTAASLLTETLGSGPTILRRVTLFEANGHRQTISISDETRAAAEKQLLARIEQELCDRMEADWRLQPRQIINTSHQAEPAAERARLAARARSSAG